LYPPPDFQVYVNKILYIVKIWENEGGYLKAAGGSKFGKNEVVN